jgi:hypothetical protein
VATSLVDELQIDASNTSMTVANLLRKALVVAAKLELSDAPAWIRNELAGYKGDVQVPPYRIVHGTLMAKHFQGWLAAQLPTADFQQKVSEQFISDSVAELEAISGQSGTLTRGFAPEQQHILQTMFQRDTEFRCFLQGSQIAGILDEIRNRVLEWAISLEKLGVKGNGLSFSDAEKERAHGVSFQVNGNVTIHNLAQTGGQTNQATGSGAHLNINSTDNSKASIKHKSGDLSVLASEFEKLRVALLSKANSPEDYTAIGVIAQAETAAKQGEAPLISRAISALGTASGWVLSVAKEIGVPLATAELKSHLNLPSA